ncbi:MAG: bacteriohemerythrin [Clostridia bacterium]
MLFKWKDTFSCNIEEIDRQHKKLFELGSKLDDIISLKDGYDHYDEIMEVLAELRDYTVYHFGYEEALMKEHNFEQLESHKYQHELFVDKINEVYNKNIDDNQERVTFEILMFVADWISTHILKTDMNYKDFLNEKGLY